MPLVEHSIVKKLTFFVPQKCINTPNLATPILHTLPRLKHIVPTPMVAVGAIVFLHNLKAPFEERAPAKTVIGRVPFLAFKAFVAAFVPAAPEAVFSYRVIF